MIISTEAIYWILTGKKLDEKLFFKIAKHHKINLSNSFKRSMSNAFTQKGTPTQKTIKNINLFFKSLFKNNTNLQEEIDTKDFLSEIDLSSTEDNIKYIESGYNDFLISSGLGNSFLSNQVDKLFVSLRHLIEKESGETVKNNPHKNDILSTLDLNNDLFIDLHNKQVTHGVFSLNILLYLYACLQLIDNVNDLSLSKKIIKEILIDVQKNKFISAFDFYTNLLIFHSKNNGNIISNEDISKELGIDLRVFYHYKSGREIGKIEHNEAILKQGGLVYFSILFWSRFINTMNNCKRLSEIKPMLDNYPHYCSVAESQLTEYNKL